MEARENPYYRVIESGKHIGYCKGLRTASWLARTYDGMKYAETKLGIADKTLDANGMAVLSFSEAQAAARNWFDELARAEHGKPAGPYSVTDVCDDSLKDYKHRRGKDEYNTNLRLERIKDALRKVKVRKLTATQIKTWHRELGEAGRLTRGQIKDDTGARKRIPLDPKDPEAQRRRLATANRMLTVLKAAVNLAFMNQEKLGISIPTKTAWQSASPTRAVDDRCRRQ